MIINDSTNKQNDLPSVQTESEFQYALERYEDLCEYFGSRQNAILHDRKEFKAWLERMHWHVLECDKLGRELEKLKSAKLDVSDMNVGDTISRQTAIDAVCKACSMEEDYHKCDGYSETSTWCDELVALRALPSAQPERRPYREKLVSALWMLPEIIYCKDCKNFRRWVNTDVTFCDFTESRVCDNDFCSRAERRADD